MNKRILELAAQAGGVWQSGHARQPNGEHAYTEQKSIDPTGMCVETFAQLIVQEYAKKTIQGLMSDPAFVQAMDEYYEQKWAHRFD